MCDERVSIAHDGGVRERVLPGGLLSPAVSRWVKQEEQHPARERSPVLPRPATFEYAPYAPPSTRPHPDRVRSPQLPQRRVGTGGQVFRTLGPGFTKSRSFERREVTKAQASRSNIKERRLESWQDEPR